MKMLTILMLSLCLCLTGMYSAARAEEDYTVDLDAFKKGSVNPRAAVHDPSIIGEDGIYYIFGSHMTAAKSENLRNWDRIAGGYTPENPVWGNLFDDGLHVFDYAGGPDSLIPTEDGGAHVWAPHVIRNRANGLYYMYYCTSSTWNASNICLAVSESVTGPYEWKAALVCSGFDKNNFEQSNVTETVDADWVKKHYLTLAGTWDYRSWPNAIDPTAFYDAGGRLWMVYGSWSGGIFLLELDQETGLPIHPEAAEGVDPYFGRRLLGGGHKSIEGPYILYDPDSEYYYLFVSYGELTSHGGYQIRVFRSRDPEGEYTDMNGRRFDGKGSHEGYGLKLSGNYNLPSVRTAYMATGHNSAMIDEDGKKYICYHTRYNDGTEGFGPIVKQYLLNEEGWPCMMPYATRKEDLSSGAYTAEQATGRYYVINQGTDISDRITEPFILYLRADGTCGGADVSGMWSVKEGTCYIRITLGDQEYSGFVCEAQDDAGTEVFCFSAVGANESVWGVRYAE